jgi:hypothetical protein
MALLVLALTACGGDTAPTPGANFNGAIDVGDTATSGAIAFKISEDGASITGVNITLLDLECKGLTIGRIHDTMRDLMIPISDGKFSTSIPALGASQVSESENYHMTTSPFDFPAFPDMGSVGQFEGKFSSSTNVGGTIQIYVLAAMTDRACELGTFPWTAKVP